MSHEAANTLRWVLTRDVASDGAVSLKLPPDLTSASRDGLVHVAALADGRRCVLLKTKVGYKDNFDAQLLCSGPLHPEEMKSAGAPPRQYISLAGHGIFEELYLRRRIDDRTFEVYFDLN